MRVVRSSECTIVVSSKTYYCSNNNNTSRAVQAALLSFFFSDSMNLSCYWTCTPIAISTIVLPSSRRSRIHRTCACPMRPSSSTSTLMPMPTIQQARRYEILLKLLRCTVRYTRLWITALTTAYSLWHFSTKQLNPFLPLRSTNTAAHHKDRNPFCDRTDKWKTSAYRIMESRWAIMSHFRVIVKQYVWPARMPLVILVTGKDMTMTNS